MFPCFQEKKFLFIDFISSRDPEARLISQKDRKPFGSERRILVNLYLKTESCRVRVRIIV